MADALDHLCSSGRPDHVALQELTRQTQILNVHYALPAVFLKHISNPFIMDVVQGVLGDRAILSNFNASRANQNDEQDYRIHIDSRKPVSRFEESYQIVANICVDDFEPDNGATVVVPGSHASGIDPREMDIEDMEIVPVSAPRGSVVFALGQTWHDIGNNRNGRRRWSIIAYYACWWIKPTFDFVNSCTEEIFSSASDLQKELLGFNSRPPADWKTRMKTVTPVEDLPPTLSQALREATVGDPR